MDDEESVKRAKAKQLLELSDCITKCMEANAKGHGLFLYSHEDEKYLTVLTFNAAPDVVCNLVHSANALMQDLIDRATADAPPKEMWN
jgi:hypothetical protein